jgi:hypothetical protein
VWGSFRTAQVIPHRYGRVRGRLVLYDDSRRRFVWADHASSAIESVDVGGQVVGGWEWRNAQDSTGQAVTMIEFTAEQDEGADLFATGLGKLDAVTGAPITNPADALFDVLATTGGKGLTRGDLALFRAEAASHGLTIGGSLEAIVTLQAAAAEICESVGAVFSPRMDRIARVHPGGTLETARVTVGNDCDVSVAANADDIVNALVVLFDYQDGEPRQVLEMAAPDSVRAYGRREEKLEARWLVDGRVAAGVATRYLRASARPVEKVEASGVKLVRPGAVVSLTHAGIPAPARTSTIVLSANENFDTARASITAEVPVGSVPRVVLVRQGSAIAPQQYASATVQTQGSDRVISVTNADGEPLAGARCVLNNDVERVSDAGGKVRFPATLMPLGEHTIAVTDPETGLVIEFTVLVS